MGVPTTCEYSDLSPVACQLYCRTRLVAVDGSGLTTLHAPAPSVVLVPEPPPPAESVVLVPEPPTTAESELGLAAVGLPTALADTPLIDVLVQLPMVKAKEGATTINGNERNTNVIDLVLFQVKGWLSQRGTPPRSLTYQKLIGNHVLQLEAFFKILA